MTSEYQFEPSTSNAFLQTFVRWRELSSDAPLEYGETLGVATLAAVAGARLRLVIEQIPFPIASNLYVLLLGPSTISRKSNSLQSAEQLLSDVVPSLLIRQPGSPEGLVEDLGRHEAQGAVLFMDELSWWFSAMKTRSHLKDMPGYLMRAYDGASISHRNKSKLVKGERIEDETVVRRPVLNIVTGATPQRLAMVSNRGDLEDGWWPRWVVCWPEGRPPLQPLRAARDGGATALYDDLLYALRRANERLAAGAYAFLTDDAWTAANDAVGMIERQIAEDPENSAIYSRADLRIFKVAMLLALANDTTQSGGIIIQVGDIEDAARIVIRWLKDAQRLMEMLGLNEFENDLNRCLSYLVRKGPTIRRRDLARSMKLSSKRLQEVEESLLERGQIDRLELDNVAFWALPEGTSVLHEAERLARNADFMSRRMGD